MESNLNGRYYDVAEDDARPILDGVLWKSWRGDKYSLKESEMKIRSK